MRKVVFVLPPDVHLLDLNGPAHIFYEARAKGLPISLHYVSMTRMSEIESSAGLAFNKLQDFLKLDLSEKDILWVPGSEYKVISDPFFLNKHQDFFDWLSTQHKKEVTICSVCTGAFFLAHSGILDHKKCTTHWKYIHNLKKRFPKVDIVENRLFSYDQGIHTSAGVTSGIDLALHVIEKEFSQLDALEVAKEIVMHIRRQPDDPQLSIYLKYRNHMESRVHKIQDFIIKNIDKKIDLNSLAQLVQTSRRNLTRIFRQETKISIGQYQEKVRVEKAMDMIRAGQKIEEVTRACGLRSSNQLRTILKKQVGRLPSEI